MEAKSGRVYAQMGEEGVGTRSISSHPEQCAVRIGCIIRNRQDWMYYYKPVVFLPIRSGVFGPSCSKIASESMMVGPQVGGGGL